MTCSKIFLNSITTNKLKKLQLNINKIYLKFKIATKINLWAICNYLNKNWKKFRVFLINLLNQLLNWQIMLVTLKNKSNNWLLFKKIWKKLSNSSKDWSKSVRPSNKRVKIDWNKIMTCKKNTYKKQKKRLKNRKMKLMNS